MHNTPNVVTHIGNRNFSSYYVGILDRFRRKIITSNEADAPRADQCLSSSIFDGWKQWRADEVDVEGSGAKGTGHHHQESFL